MALPLRGDDDAWLLAALSDESGLPRGVVDGDRQESGVGRRGLRDDVDRAGDALALDDVWFPARMRARMRSSRANVLGSGEPGGAPLLALPPLGVPRAFM